MVDFAHWENATKITDETNPGFPKLCSRMILLVSHQSIIFEWKVPYE
jgi:hypothetical protein